MKLLNPHHLWVKQFHLQEIFLQDIANEGWNAIKQKKKRKK